jgi:hypothetical protein
LYWFAFYNDQDFASRHLSKVLVVVGSRQLFAQVSCGFRDVCPNLDWTLLYPSGKPEKNYYYLNALDEVH